MFGTKASETATALYGSGERNNEKKTSEKNSDVSGESGDEIT